MGRVRKLAIGWRAALAVAFGLIAAVVVSSHASAGGTTIAIGQVTKATGETAQLQLLALNVGAPGLGAWQVDIDYDSDIVSPTMCTPGTGGLCNVYFGPSTVRVVGADANGLEGNVVLGTLSFSCVQEGSSALAITAVEFADATTGEPQPIAVGVEHGTIHCLTPEPPPSNLNGDANCDGLVNSIDALIVLQYVARLRSSVPCPALADYNHDGRISAVDAALILQRDARLI